MKEEIKEILKKLKENISIVSVEEEHLLLDYITNLQKENKIQKEKIEHLLIDLKVESEYKQRNEKAIKFIGHEFFKRHIILGLSEKNIQKIY